MQSAPELVVHPADAAAGAVSPAAGAVSPAGAVVGIAASEQARVAASHNWTGANNQGQLVRLAALAATLLGTASARARLSDPVAGVPAAGAPSAGIPTQIINPTEVFATPTLTPALTLTPEPAQLSPVDELCAQVVRSGQTLVLVDLTGADSGAGAFLGVPLIGKAGLRLGVLYVLETTPRSWTAPEVTLLEQIGSLAVAELELSALTADYADNQAILALAVEAGQIGTFEWDLVTGKFTCGEQLLALFGYDTSAYDLSLEEFFVGRIHPESMEQVHAAIEQAIVTLGAYEAEYRVLLPGGETRWLLARGRVFDDGTGTPLRLLGATYDTTAVHEGEAKVTQVLEAMPAGFCSLDRDWCFTYVNAEAERILGMTRAAMLGVQHWELFPTETHAAFDKHYRLALQTGEPVHFEAYAPTLDAWFEMRAWPNAGGLSVYFLDVTARRAAQRLADQAVARWALLAEVTAELSGTLDGQEGVGRLARLVVPALADWCLVTVLDEDEHGGSRRVARDVGWWHFDPALRASVDRFCALRVASCVSESLVDRVLRTGRSVVVARDAQERLCAVLAPGEARDLAATLAPGSSVLFPLRGREHTVGVLTLFNSPERGPLSAHELATAAEVADRAGMALDNARLFTQQRELAEALQRSLLSPPPQTPDVDVVVRYAPAAAAAQVGGTGTTCSASPTARRCSSSVMWSVTTPPPPPRWASCGRCCAGSPPATGVVRARCSRASIRSSPPWRSTPRRRCSSRGSSRPRRSSCGGSTTCAGPTRATHRRW